jgi:uncharacterized membrane protein (DUF2068 family)
MAATGAIPVFGSITRKSLFYFESSAHGSLMTRVPLERQHGWSDADLGTGHGVHHDRFHISPFLAVLSAKGELDVSDWAHADAIKADCKAVLAVIVVLVVYTILNEAPHEIMFLWRMRAWTDFLQMTGTFVLTILFSIEVS